ncbi:MAG: M61 family metallopeptidase, partial [Polyangiales bacterium]
MRRARYQWAVVVAAAIASCLVGGCDRGAGEEEPDAERPEIEAPEPVEPRAPEGEAVEYTLRFDDLHTHHVDVEAVFPTDGADAIEVFMAVWTPGSYLVREYARHVEEISASTLGGEPLEMDKTRKNRWEITTEGEDRVVVRYRLYAREMTVRSNFVDSEIASLNGAPTFISLVGGQDRPHDVLFVKPDAWEDVVTALPEHPDGEPHHWVARDYRHLVDSPIVAGDAEIYDLDVGLPDVPHTLANFSEHGVWDGERSAEDVSALVRTQLDFWGTVPYPRYIFQNLLVETGGGLEHRHSTQMMASRWMTRKRDDYLRWLGLVSHEFFHTWNVKQLHPAPLGPFDFEKENYVRTLWVVEGITSYYDDLLLRRAGLMTEEEYLDKLAGQIEDVQMRPGREVQSLEMSSYDAWIKYYRPDENSKNVTISYYQQGAVVAFLLDARIRELTRGGKSLDDVMRLAYERFAPSGPLGGDEETGFTPAQFREVVAEVAGESLDDFFARYVEGIEELDYAPALDYYGLRFAEPPAAAEDEEPAGWLGVEVDDGDGQLVVERVVRGSPAYEAGINARDEILAIGDFRVPPGKLAERLERY